MDFGGWPLGMFPIAPHTRQSRDGSVGGMGGGIGGGVEAGARGDVVVGGGAGSMGSATGDGDCSEVWLLSPSTPDCDGSTSLAFEIAEVSAARDSSLGGGGRADGAGAIKGGATEEAVAAGNGSDWGLQWSECTGCTLFRSSARTAAQDATSNLEVYTQPSCSLA